MRSAVLGGLAVIAALGRTASAETKRVAVIVGNNAGNDATDRLRYAEDDAAKVAQVLTELGGVAPADMFLVDGQDRAHLLAAQASANARIGAYRGAHDSVVVIFYFSGHSDGLALELGRDRYEFAVLRKWLADTSADVRLAFVDACKSGALVAAKGGSPGPAFQIRLTDDIASTGEAVITSSAATEDALESQEIAGSFFTHHLVSGLRGAADTSGDHRVTLSEAYRYAYQHTIATSGATLAGPQHPVYDYRISGQGEVVLTELARPTAALAFSADLDRALVIEPVHGGVIAEIGRGGSGSLAVSPGTYTVREWRGDKIAEGRITVAARQTRTVAWAELSPITLAPPRAKGDDRRGDPRVAGARKSEGTSLGLAFGVTAAGALSIIGAVGANSEPLALLGVGLGLVGPSAGHLYAGEYGHAAVTIGLRVGGVALALEALNRTYEEGGDNNALAAVGLIAAGSVALYDFVDARAAARRHDREAGFVITVAPVPAATGTAVGIVAGSTF